MKENIIVDPPSEIVITSDRMVGVDLNEAKTTEAEDTAADKQETASTPPEAEEDEDTPEAEDEPKPQKPSKDAPPTMEERMFEMLLREKHPDTLASALDNGKTIRGAWNYVVSVMKNAYIAEHGRKNGGCCGSPDVVVAIAERYLREFPEGYTEPEAAHTPKKTEAKSATNKAKAAEKVVKTAKAAAKSAKDEAKAKAEKVKSLFGNTQLSFTF